MDFLMRDFQKYWRENSEIWRARYKAELYEYDEAAAQLVMHAFLQRIVNGGGHVHREAAAGTKRVDLCVEYGGRKYPVELKILQSESSRADSLKQLRGYMDKLEADAGWLVVFDRSPKRFWGRKTYIKEVKVDRKRVTVVGC
jgi:hypothetical protein